MLCLFYSNKCANSKFFTPNFKVFLFMGSGIKRYDLYRKAIDGLQVKTSVGGLSDFCDSYIIYSIYHISYHNRDTNLNANVFVSRFENSDNVERRISVGECNSWNAGYNVPSVTLRLLVSIVFTNLKAFDLHFEATKSKQPTDIEV